MSDRTDRHFRAKVAAFLALRRSESDYLDNLLGNRRDVARGAALLHQGAAAASAFVLLSGWAMRFRTLADGRRQVLGIVLPGDLVGVDSHLLAEATATVAAITPCRISEFRAGTLVRMVQEHPRLASTLLWMTMREEAFLGERLMSAGCQSAFARLGHFHLELYYRLRLVGLARDAEFDCPLTQEIVADALGMSMVHVSRTSQSLRHAGLLLRTQRTVRLLDRDKLERITDFAGLYLGRKLGPEEKYLAPKFGPAGGRGAA